MADESQLSNLMSFLGLFQSRGGGAWKAQRPLWSGKTHSSMGNSSNKLHPWSSIQNLQAAQQSKEVPLSCNCYCLFNPGERGLVNLVNLWNFLSLVSFLCFLPVKRLPW